MTKKSSNTGIFIAVAIVIAAVLIAPNLNFNFSTTNIEGDTQDQLNNPQSGDCYATLSKSVVNVGDTITGTIQDGANTLCYVFANDGTTWSQIGSGTTDSNGYWTLTDTIDIPGTFVFRAICGTCLTAPVTLQVNALSNCIDSDGNDIFTFGHVDDTEAMVSYPDECYDTDSVIEYVCNPLPSAMTPQACPTTHKCEGGRCILKTGYNLGDEVFYYGKSWDSLDGGYSVELQLDDANIETGGPCHLGARIYRKWDYAVPGCEGSVGTVDWTLFDSNGYRWGVFDTSPTSQTVEVCPCAWDGVTNWYFEVVNTKSPNCPVEFEYAFTIFVCECD